MNKLIKFSFLTLLTASTFVTSCSDDDHDEPHHEHDHEQITDIKLIFTNNSDATDIVEATAKDADGEGIEELKVLDTIELDGGKTYTLTYEIMNNLETPGEDIGEEIAEEDDEHQIFYSFSNDAFTSLSGNGNIDKASDPLNYEDKDDNNNPVGLVTEWETANKTLTNGSFKIQLQHQPDGIKTSTSGAGDGEDDFTLEFVLDITSIK